MKVPVSPFLMAPESAVSHGGWHLTTAEGDVLLPAELDHWDFRSTLALSAAVAVDRRAVAESCQLEVGSGLVVLVTAHSDHTRSEQPVLRVEVPHQDRFDLALQLDLPGHELGGRLTLRTMLVTNDPKPLSRLAPQDPGSVLWRGRQSTQLQGIGAQFPTDASDFTVTRPESAGAAWDLNVNLDDPDAAFLSAARLTLNTGLPAVQALLDGATDRATEQLRATLHWDVTRQLVVMALESDEVVAADMDPEATSVEGVLRNVLARVWPSTSPVVVRGWWRDDRARVETAVQHHCGVVP
ncbi:MAG TPA: hypothetical protein VK507_14170 [Iamia sp.]|nr:hypothetical protein [Iamia sp.]